MQLEQQLSALAELGIALEPDVSIDDLLYSSRREAARSAGGSGASIPKCITQTGDYVAIAERLCELTGRTGAFLDLRDHVDLEAREAWIEYTIEGRRRHWGIEVSDDWADMMVVSYMMADLERDGWKFRKRDNGQAMVLYYLDEARFERLNQLATGALSTVIVE